MVIAVACVPAPAVAAAGGLATVGRWEAHGKGGARVRFTVLAKGARRFAGNLVALCGEAADVQQARDARTMYELDSSGRAKAQHPSLRFWLGKRRGRVSYGGDVKDAKGNVACAASAFASLQGAYIGPVYEWDGHWKVTGTLGTNGSLFTYGNGALVEYPIVFFGLPGFPQTPEAPCTIGTVGIGFAALAGLYYDFAPLSPGGTFAHSAIIDDAGTLTTHSVAAQFTSPTTAVGVYDGTAVLGKNGSCSVAGTFAATLVEKRDVYEVRVLPGRSPVALLDHPDIRLTPEQAARRIQQRRPKVGRNNCRESRRLVKRLTKDPQGEGQLRRVLGAAATA